MKLYLKDIQYCLPDSNIDNIAEGSQLGKDENFVRTKIGVEQRWIVSGKEKVSDIATRALCKLLVKNALDGNDIQCLIVVTQTPDYQLPQTSSIIKKKAGLSDSLANFDVSLGCSGFVYSLSIIMGFMQFHGLTRGVLITTDTYSTIVDKCDPNTGLLFSDAAAACLITSDGFGKLGHSIFGNDSENYDALIVADKSSSLNMNGRKIYRMAIDNLPGAIEQCLIKNELDLQKIDRWYFHQGSQFVLDSICKSMGLRKEIVPDNIRKIGNTTSSSIPILMKDDEKNLRSSKIIGLVGFGVGLSWGCAFMEIGEYNDL